MTRPLRQAEPVALLRGPLAVLGEGSAADGSGAGAGSGRDIEALTRELGRASAAIDATMAAVLGVSTTDFACWTIVLAEQRPIPAGRLARLAELSTGAITGVLDRLERRGLVHRTPDPYDRRRVLVAVDQQQRQRLTQVWDPVHQVLASVLDRRTEPERAVIATYLHDVVHAVRAASLTPRA